MNEFQIKISKMITDYQEYSFFYGKASEINVPEIESILKFSLPESYKWYICTYGSGGLDGTDIFGVTKIGSFQMIEATNDYKEHGIPDNLIVIEDLGEYIYCLDLNRMKNDECPVVNWSMNDNDGVIDKYDNFYEFIISRFSDTIENLE